MIAALLACRNTVGGVLLALAARACFAKLDTTAKIVALTLTLTLAHLESAIH